MGGERFDTPQPEAYLFGENADLNFLGSKPTPVSATVILNSHYLSTTIYVCDSTTMTLHIFYQITRNKSMDY